MHTKLGRKDWNGLRPGFVPGASRGQAWLLNLEMQRATLQQVEGSPTMYSRQEKRGGTLSVNTVLRILPSLRVPRPVPKAVRGAVGLKSTEREEGRRRLGELVGVSGER